MFSLEGKTAVITGGASGIGLAISRLFASQGATVHLFEVNYDLALKEAEHIVADGGKAKAHSINITNQQKVKEEVSTIAAFSNIDILVNNAGIAHIGTAESTNEEDFDRVMNVNVKGTYNCIHAVIPFMKEQGSGVILNMASVVASVGIPDRFVYSTTKGAILAMTLSVARDYVKHGIRCNCISPARVHTPFVDGFLKNNYPGNELDMFNKLSASQPIGRMGTPDEIASLALYLCSDEAGFITGSDYPIDGGFIRINN